MVMDLSVRELSGLISGFDFRDVVPDGAAMNTIKPEDPENLFTQNNLLDPPIFLPATTATNVHSVPPAGSYLRSDSPEDSEIFSDIALTYISKMLMEEDMDDKVYMYQGGPALRAAEKPFYDILGQKYPPSPDRPPLYTDSSGSPDDSSCGQYGKSGGCGVVRDDQVRKL